MRQGQGAVFPRQRQHLGAFEATMPRAVPLSPDVRANVARLFYDLRQVLGLTQHFAAAQLVTEPDVIMALESGEFERLTDWEETSRVVLAYTALAGIDGEPALRAIQDILRQSASRQTAQKRQSPPAGSRFPVGRFLHAGAMMASGAKWLPTSALRQVRERPERALYALSLPAVLVLLALNTSIVRTAFSFAYVPRPAAEIVRDVRMFLQVQFAPVREGLRWIDVDDPRERRGDKLLRRRQSD